MIYKAKITFEQDLGLDDNGRELIYRRRFMMYSDILNGVCFYVEYGHHETIEELISRFDIPGLGPAKLVSESTIRELSEDSDDHGRLTYDNVQLLYENYPRS